MRKGRTLTLNGQTKSVAEWASVIGVTRQLIHQRIRYGWPDEAVLTVPPRSRRLFVSKDDTTKEAINADR